MVILNLSCCNFNKLLSCLSSDNGVSRDQGWQQGLSAASDTGLEMNQSHVHPGAAEDETGDEAEDTSGDKVTTWGPSGKPWQTTGAGEVRDGDPRKGCSGQWRPINANSILTVFAVIMVIIYALLWKMHLPFLSFLLKLHSYTHGKQKELWKCAWKRCIKSSTQFLCWGCSVSIQAYGRILFLWFVFFWLFLKPLYSKFRYVNMFKKQPMRTVLILQCYFF